MNRVKACISVCLFRVNSTTVLNTVHFLGFPLGGLFGTGYPAKWYYTIPTMSKILIVPNSLGMNTTSRGNKMHKNASRDTDTPPYFNRVSCLGCCV